SGRAGPPPTATGASTGPPPPHTSTNPAPPSGPDATHPTRTEPTADTGHPTRTGSPSTPQRTPAATGTPRSSPHPGPTNPATCSRAHPSPAPHATASTSPCRTTYSTENLVIDGPTGPGRPPRNTTTPANFGKIRSRTRFSPSVRSDVALNAANPYDTDSDPPASCTAPDATASGVAAIRDAT